MRRLAVLFVMIACLGAGYSQSCSLSGTAAWSEQVRNVIAGCDNRFLSPDGKLILSVDPEGTIRLMRKNQAQDVLGTMEPPGMLSWSPASNAFFVNDGQGSGMASFFRLFRLQAGRVTHDLRIETSAVALFRSEKKCGHSAADPSIWGVGWSPDGRRVYLLVQATVNDPCGEAGSFIGLTAEVANASIIDHFSESATKTKFRNLLPREMYGK